MFSLCPHLGGGQVSEPTGGGQVSEPTGGGGQVQLGGVRSVSRRGGVRSSWRGGGQVSEPMGGGGQVQLGGGVRSSRGGSASCALLRAVCLLRSRRRTFLFYFISGVTPAEQLDCIVNAFCSILKKKQKTLTRRKS